MLYEGKQLNEEMHDYHILFQGKLNSFNSIVIGKGKDCYSGMYLKLDKINLSVYNSKDSVLLYECNHNLLFKDYIGVNILVDYKSPYARIEVLTNGGYFVVEDVMWNSRMGTVFVEKDEPTCLSECKLSYYCNGWNKPIWLFGDSYLNLESDKRWTSYLLNSGANNIMLNGYPGRTSKAALNSFESCLKYGTPQKLIWCMGMNNPDVEEVNVEWKDVLDEIKELCEKHDIELILTTIPSVPTLNNDYKNEYVKNSGFKYIDFAEAVGAYDNVEWYEDFLEKGENRVHPTSKGALALYSEAVVSCPELLGKE